MDALARRIAAITAAEPHLLRRSPREIARAHADGRAVVRVEDGAPIACLHAFRYGAWAEVGAGWVAPSHRGRGLFVDMHRELVPRLHARGLRVFEFPGTPGVERALARMGAQRLPLSTLPASVLARFVAERLAPMKLASYARSLRAGTHRTSTRLHVFLDEPR